MSTTAAPFPLNHIPDAKVIDNRFFAALTQLRSRTDVFLAKVLVVQWLATIGLAVVVSPRTWDGTASSTHIHVWAAIFLGGAISLFPAWLGWKRPGRDSTRHVLACAQMLASALLIHITGGRIETHFHVFGSLALLALYRDVRVFATAIVVVYVDHLMRGFFWPQSVYGVFSATIWRSLEHAGWVLFEAVFLTFAARTSLREMRELVARQIGLEGTNREREQEVRDRTQEVQDRTQDLARSEEHFRTFFRDSPIGLYRVKPNGEFLMANPALLKTLGFISFEELKSAGPEVLQKVFDSERQQFIGLFASTNGVLHRDVVWRRRDGAQLQIRESGRAFRGSDNRIVHIEGTVDDVTEHRQLEERYQQAQKVQAIGQLAGGVAHDFNNILTVISGYSQLMLSDPELPQPVRTNLTNIREAGNRAAGLTRQLLAFSRKQRMQPRVIQLNAVTAEMDSMLQRLVGENIRIRTIGISGLSAVKADPGQIQQVVMNLVVNARDAMPSGGQLTIETANVVLGSNYARSHPDVTPGNYVMLAVSDTGTGMTPEVQARLFEPFFTTKPLGYGTGLGLATCHGIIKQSGGHIAAYSEVGHGTTFKVYLPAVDAVPAPLVVDGIRQQRKGDGEYILLVEDDRTVREFGGQVLLSLGYQVIPASNGLEALQRFKEHPEIELVITDVIMPNMGGRELVENLRKASPQMRVLFTSGYTFDALGETNELEAGSDFLPKPYSPDQLEQKVHTSLHPVGDPVEAEFVK